jgi:subtilisin family serine protease
MWLILSLLATLLLAKMRVIEHATPPTQAPRTQLFNVESVATPESIWLIMVMGENVTMSDTQSDIFLGVIKESLSKDSCTLLLSRTSAILISLRIYCSLTAILVVGDKPSIPNTMGFLMSCFTGGEKIIFGRNTPFSKPSQWRSSETTSQFGYHVQSNSGNVVDNTVYSSDTTAGTQYSVEWHLARIDTREATADGAYSFRNDASGVDIYIPDSGIRESHKDFHGRALFLHDTVRDGVTTDCNGHGTHVAGIAASSTYGVAKKATIFAVRVLDCNGGGVLDNILEGINVIIETANERLPRRGVINLSFGGEKDAILDALIDLLRQHNLVVVMAAGNEDSDACTFSPSNRGIKHYVLAVGASDRLDNRPWWSNYGACVGISAPGVSITSTWYTSDTALAILSGTSMSAPIVTGVAAMILHDDPSLSVTDVNEIIVQWATPRIIGSTSNVGGGSSLIYSLVDPFTQVNQGGAGATQQLPANDAISLPEGSLVFCIALTIIYILCLA